MPSFSVRSLQNLTQGVHPDLAKVFQEVIKYRDCSILDGIRTRAQQEQNVARGLSKTMDSQHLPQADGLGHAVDAAPYPQRWNENRKIDMTCWEVDQVYFAGFVMGVAALLGVNLRYGGDWNSDDALVATGFRDLDHFELAK